MKKLTVVLALLLVLTTTSVFATGLGLQAGSTYGGSAWDKNLAVTFKLNSSPWVFAVNGRFTNYGGGVGLSADQWVINQTIAAPVNFYLGWGMYAGMGFAQNYYNFNFGGRIPIGINAFLFKKQFGPYFQIVPSLGLQFGSGGEFSFPDWGVAGNLGFRFWF